MRSRLELEGIAEEWTINTVLDWVEERDSWNSLIDQYDISEEELEKLQTMVRSCINDTNFYYGK